MGQIYIIMNEINGKCYVGQTVNTFEQRYGGRGGWAREHNHNPILKKSAKKHGIENFSIWVAEEGSFSTEELNQKEQFWADTLNSYVPSGYNLKGCGDNRRHSLKSRAKIGHAIVCSNGKTYISQKQAADELGIRQAAIANMLNGKTKHVNGHVFATAGSAVPSPMPAENWGDNKGLRIKCSNGKIYETIMQASEDTGISDKMIQRVVGGRSGRKTARGLMFAKVLEEFNMEPNQSAPKAVVRNDGIVFTSTKQAADAIHTSCSNVRKCLQGKFRQIKGYSFAYYNGENQ